MDLRFGSTIVGLALLTACRPAPVTTLPPDVIPAVVHDPIPVPPDRIGAYQINTTRDYDVNGGTMYRYDGADVYFDVFVYPIPFQDAGCDASCRWLAVTAEADAFVNSFPLLIQHRYLLDIDLTLDTALTIGSQTQTRVRYVQAEVVNDQNEPGTTYYVLHAIPGYFVKLRITDVTRTLTPKVVLAFTTEVAAQLPVPFTCTIGPSSVEPVSVTTTVHNDTAEVTTAVSAALEALEYRPAFAAAGWWTTLPQFTWSSTFEDGELFGRHHPGIQITLGARPTNDSTSIAVLGRALCDLGPGGLLDDARVETLVQMTTTLELMHDITKRLDDLRGR